MKKYLCISGILNIALGLIANKYLISYMNISIRNNYAYFIDLMVLFGIVLIVTLINYLLFNLLKVKNKKIYISIPSIVFMLSAGLSLILMG